MAVKYSKFFTVTGATTLEPLTILVELVEGEGFRNISIGSLDGEYNSAKEFYETHKVNGDKEYHLIPVMLPDARQLVDMLKEAIAASEEAGG